MDMEQRREAFKLALEWIRNIPLCDCDIDLATAYAEGVICGWNNPNWISVNDKLPKRNNTDRFSEIVIAWTIDGQIDTTYYDFEKNEWGWMSNVTHWMALPQPPIKED